MDDRWTNPRLSSRHRRARIAAGARGYPGEVRLLTDDRYRVPRRRLRRALIRGLERVMARTGFDVLEHDYYSPLLRPGALPAEHWRRPRDTPGVDLDPGRQLQYLEETLAPYVREFHPPLHADGDRPGFFLRNDYYGPVDAEVLYATIRSLKPGRMLELGSGFSTLVSLQAHRANAREGHKTAYRIFDPYAGDHIRMDAAELAIIERLPATEVPLAEFASLEGGDLLFIDTTHTVRAAGEVNYLVLEVLPRLRPGVVVHVHDVFLPWEYPRFWMEGLRRQWAEQYLLQAFLACNPS
jgi:predicted O-methyltransferase YrrM